MKVGEDGSVWVLGSAQLTLDEVFYVNLPFCIPNFPSSLYIIYTIYLLIVFQVNLEYLESKLECLDGEEVQQIQDNINCLFHHCVQAMGEEHQIKVVNALQVCPAEDEHGRGWSGRGGALVLRAVRRTWLQAPEGPGPF